ncbi:MAG: cyanophycinase [Bacteroidota bacterium]
MKLFYSISLLFPVFFTACFAQQNSLSMLTTGPENGSLIVAGGGRLPDEILLKFIELAGGQNARIVVVPTAGGQEEYDQSACDFLSRFGIGTISMLHTTDPKIADSAAFVEPLKDATGVWFRGGRQWRLVDAYAGTKTEQMFWKVLERGGVIGGTSAGATIQGSYLARGDTKSNQIMMGDHEAGFGFIKNVAIDQHVLARNRQFDLYEIVRSKPELLGIGVDEGTALLVNGDQFEVIGDSYVLVYDGQFYSREGFDQKKLPAADSLFYFLKKGEKYNMRTRKVIE